MPPAVSSHSRVSSAVHQPSAECAGALRPFEHAADELWETRAMRSPALLALAACGGTAKPSPAGTSQPPYLALFERGRAWSLPGETVTGERQGEAWPAKDTRRGNVECSVAEVKPIADATVARLQCAPPNAGLLVVGAWVATPAGLYHPALPIDDPDELALLGDEDLLITAKAKEREHSQASDGMQHTIEAFSHDRSWCVRDSTVVDPERRHYTLCFGPGGITGGGELVVGERSWHRTTFGSVPADPDDPTLGQAD
jgi:hypothetical protein